MNTCQRFEDMSRLYHFTSFDAACKIIISKELRFGKLYLMNDILESHKISYLRILQVNDKLWEKEKAYYAEEEMHRYQQISFTQDKLVGDVAFLGFDMHTMWGLYAQRGYGVCLVFDKDKLVLGERDYAKEVEYFDIIATSYDFHNKSRAGIKAEIWRRKDEIFFHKRREWEHEQEFRIIRRARREDDDEYLDISEALSFVIICKEETIEEMDSICGGDNFWTLKTLNNSLPILSYENGLDGYSLFDYDYGPIWTEQCGFM